MKEIDKKIAQDILDILVRNKLSATQAFDYLNYVSGEICNIATLLDGAKLHNEECVVDETNSLAECVNNAIELSLESKDTLLVE